MVLRSRRWAFTLIEIAGALALLAILLLIALPQLFSVFNEQRDNGTAQGLVSAQVQGRTVAVPNGYRFPVDFQVQMSRIDPRFVAGEVTSESEVSVTSSVGTTAIYVMLSPTGACLVMLDRIDLDVATWAIDETPISCSAAAVAGAESLVVGSAKVPAVISL